MLANTALMNRFGGNQAIAEPLDYKDYLAAKLDKKEKRTDEPP